MKPTDKSLRELDAWIAEKMFGRKWYLFDGHICQLEEPSKWQARYGGQEVDYPRPDDERDITGVPHYTTDPAAAMMVLEKCVLALEVRRAFPAIEKYSDFDGFQGWKVTALFSTGNQNTFSEVAETLPLAICLFAKALFSK